MQDKDHNFLIEAYSKVCVKESEGMDYPTNWDKGFKYPMAIASGGNEVPYLKNGKWFILTYNKETGEHEIYSYSEDTYYPEDSDDYEEDESSEPNEDNFRDDVEADADALASAGYGTDEDYGGGDDRY